MSDAHPVVLKWRTVTSMFSVRQKATLECMMELCSDSGLFSSGAIVSAVYKRIPDLYIKVPNTAARPAAPLTVKVSVSELVGVTPGYPTILCTVCTKPAVWM